jgi:LytTr DNA-binding domain
MANRQIVRRAAAAVQGHRAEVAAHVLLWGAFIVLMASGDTNGVGYFQQPGDSLLFPLLHGAAWNAATFLVSGLVLLPLLFERRWLRAAGCLATFALLVLAGKSLGEWLYIRFAVPDLRSLTMPALALENAYSFASAWFLGMLYFVARRGIVRGTVRRTGAITVRSGTSRHRIQVEDIRFLKAEGNYVALHTDRRPLLVLTTMAAALAQLPADRFLRIHRSFAVNLAYVSGATSDTVQVADERLPLGRTYLKDARERIDLWLQSG